MQLINSIKNSSFYHKIFLVVLVIVFYYNSIPNEIALDDGVVLSNNEYVLKGIKGIPDIITHESFYGATQKNPERLGWRYRPLSLIAFAVEHQLWGNFWPGYHFMNLLYFAILILVAYQLLRKLFFEKEPIIAFFVCALFMTHPNNTEVVANIKSRDEIFALLFSLLYFNYFILYLNSEKRVTFALALVSLTAALFSKETSITIVPASILLSYCCTSVPLKNSIQKSIVPFFISVLFVVIRLSISGLPKGDFSITNDPYFYASFSQKCGTVLWVLFLYLKNFLLPFTQCFDYGYNQIPYIEVLNPLALFSLAIHLSFAAYGIINTHNRKPVGALILLYLLGIFLMSNFVIAVGPIMADRFFFNPGFYLFPLLGILYYNLGKNQRIKSITSYPSVFISCAILLFFFVKVHARNREWKNNKSLYFADINKSPNSFRSQAFCGIELVSEANELTDSIQINNQLNEARKYFRRAYAIYPNYFMIFENWGLSYYRQNKIDSAEWAWGQLKKLKPNSNYISANDEMIARARYNILVLKFREALPRNNYLELLNIQRSAMKTYTKMSDGWLMLGKLYSLTNNPDSAIYSLNKCLEIDATNKEALQIKKDLGK